MTQGCFDGFLAQSSKFLLDGAFLNICDALKLSDHFRLIILLVDDSVREELLRSWQGQVAVRGQFFREGLNVVKVVLVSPMAAGATQELLAKDTFGHLTELRKVAVCFISLF